jgi:hypothetical protein
LLLFFRSAKRALCGISMDGATAASEKLARFVAENIQHAVHSSILFTVP